MKDYNGNATQNVLYLPIQGKEIVYPMLQIMVQEKGSFNIALDEFAGSSFITNSAAEALNFEATAKQAPYCINGIGNHYPEINDE